MEDNLVSYCVHRAGIFRITDGREGCESILPDHRDAKDKRANRSVGFSKGSQSVKREVLTCETEVLSGETLFH